MLRFRFILFAAAIFASAPMFLHAQAPAGAESASASAAKASKENPTAVPFRIGMIYSAELSKVKPAFDEESEFDKPAFENPAWIEIVVKIENGRSISRFDYELIVQKNNYACFAVSEGSDAYSVNQEKWVISKTTNMRFYRLLFPVKQTELAGVKNGLLPVTLKMKLYDTTLPAPEFHVCVMPDGVRFLSVSRIPKEGICNISYPDLPPSLK